MKLIGFITIAIFLAKETSENQAPYFNPPLKSTYFFSEYNLTKPGDILLSLSVNEIDDDQFEFGVLGEFYQKMLKIKKIASNKADVILRQIFDREVQEKYENITFWVRDQPGNKVYQSVRFVILDVDDNKPIFVNAPYRVNIPENINVGSVIYSLISAFDIDGPLYREFKFIISENSFFNIHTFPISSGRYNGSITLIKQLDYETTQQHLLKITAKSLNSNLVSSSELIVNVIDSPDQPPIFSQSSYYIKIAEELEIGEIVLKVAARDGDFGINSPCLYDIVPNQSSKYFTIDKYSGDLKIAQKIDRESDDINDLLEIIVIAYERDDVTSRTQVHINVAIVDINDNEPIFNKNLFNLSIAENGTPGTKLRILNDESIQASDSDKGINGTLLIRLYNLNDETNSDFEIYPRIANNFANIDIRLKEHHNLKSKAGHVEHYILVAKDSGIDGKETKADLFIKVETINEFTPKFDQDIYSFTLNENSEFNTTVGYVNAFDGDSNKGLFGDISYILKNGQNRFEIDTKSGRIYTISNSSLINLDRETQDVYYLSIDAIDDGGLQSNTKVIIKLSDVNDNPPSFFYPHNSIYRGYIEENSSEWLEKIKLQANDDDIGVNAHVVFEIVGGLFRDKFEINTTSNTIELRQGELLDFEEIKARNDVDDIIFDEQLKQDEVLVSLVVLVRNVVPPFYSSKTYARIIVKDLNDNFPKFEQKTYSTMILETRKSGDVIEVKAFDRDAENTPNSKINYQILSGGKDKFMINGQTGFISIIPNANLDRDLFGNNYTLEIQAYDLGPNRNIEGSADICHIFIKIIDVNNKAPQFSFKQRSIDICEDFPPEKAIFVVKAEDNDENSQIVYKLKELDNASKNVLKIDKDNGEITLLEKIDYELKNQLNILIIAEDINADVNFSPQISSINFTINILDVNDNAPIFIGNATFDEDMKTFYQVESIRENTKIGSLVARVKATDADSKSKITFKIVENQNIFKLDETTGELFVIGQIDYETTERQINLTIISSDNGDKISKESKLILSFEVEDLNDNAPNFLTITLFESKEKQSKLSIQNGLTIIRIKESTKIGTEILQINALDNDQEENAAINYSISKSSMKDKKYFDINSKNGSIYLISKLSRETNLIHIIDVIASDNGIPSLSSHHSIKFVVVDNDDNAAVFKMKELCNFMECSSNNQSLIVTVQEEKSKSIESFKLARIADERRNELDICYFLIGDYLDIFSVDKKSALISINKRIDREFNDFYEIHLKATENCSYDFFGKPYNPHDLSILRIQVNVIDLNDNSPRFEQTHNQIGLLPDLIYSDKIFEGLAFDQDISSQLKFNIVPYDNLMYNNTTSKFNDVPFRVEFDKTKTINKTRYSSFRLKSETYFRSSPVKNTRFDFKLRVYDEDNQTDTANFQVYVLNKNQILNFIFAKSVDQIKELRAEFQNYINNHTGYNSCINMILAHRNENNIDSNVNKYLTDMIIHFKNSSTNDSDINIIQAKDIVKIIDYSKDFTLIDKYKLVAIKQLSSHTATSLLILNQNAYSGNTEELVLSSPSDNYPYIIIKLICFVSFSIIVFITIFIVIVCCFIQQKYKNKLKTERAIAKTFNQRPDDELHKNFFTNLAFESTSITNIPGTNLYSYEGSNPMWLKKYESLKNSLSSSTSSEVDNTNPKNEENHVGISSFYLKSKDGKDEENEGEKFSDENNMSTNSFNKQTNEKLKSKSKVKNDQKQNFKNNFDSSDSNKEQYDDLYAVESTVI